MIIGMMLFLVSITLWVIRSLVIFKLKLQMNNFRVGLSTELTDVSIVSDLDGFVDTNCVFDFDIARENNLNFNIDNGILSDEIIFENKILSDFTESVGNRVLSIDDLGPQFNSNPRATAFTVVTTFPLSDFRFRKYITYLKDIDLIKKDN